ncbi:MAG TPA: transposase [Ktedonobacteraceae bacterium]|jgi:putative transposase
MQLVEQHVISKTDSRYAAIDKAAFASKNLYNAALYEIRQSFIHQGKYLYYNQMDKSMQRHEAYRALPSKVSQQVLKLLDKNWKSFFAALEAYREDPSKFLGCPTLPGYKDKTHGRNVLVYTIQAISLKKFKKGVIKPSGLPIEIKTKRKHIDQVRIVPRNGHYVIEVVYEQEEVQAEVNPAFMAAVDIGVNNLVALTSNKSGFIPRIVNGGPIKSINQFYNKQRERFQKKMSTNHPASRQLENITNKRTRRIDHYMHTTSKRLIDVLVAEGIGTLIIGKNPCWKQDPTMHKKDKQHFVQLPHARFIDMLCYKARLVGIQVILQEESYTSKASFLDLDPIPTYGKVASEPVFSGRRVKRGMYKAANGRKINADVNGSYNIMRKASPNVFWSNGVEDVNEVLASLVVHPERIVVPLRTLVCGTRVH